MRKRRIALDSGLGNYRSILTSEGFEVIDMVAKGPRDADAILLSGMDRNIAGNETRASDAFVLDVTGRQPEEVLYDLRKHFALAEGSEDFPTGPGH